MKKNITSFDKIVFGRANKFESKDQNCKYLLKKYKNFTTFDAQQLALLHTEKSFRNLIKSTRNQIEFTVFRLIWKQTDTSV